MRKVRKILIILCFTLLFSAIQQLSNAQSTPTPTPTVTSTPVINRETLPRTDLFGGLAWGQSEHIYGWKMAQEDTKIIRYGIAANLWEDMLPYEVGKEWPVRGCYGGGRIWWADRSHETEWIGITWYDINDNSAQTTSPFNDASLKYYTDGGLAYANAYIYVGNLQILYLSELLGTYYQFTLRDPIHVLGRG